MTQDKYLPTNTHGMLTHLIEELSECQKILAKIKRFGFQSTWDGKTNIRVFNDEFVDVLRTHSRLMDHIAVAMVRESEPDDFVPEGPFSDGRVTLSEINVTFKQVDGTVGPEITFVDIHNLAGESIAVGDWSTDGDYENLCIRGHFVHMPVLTVSEPDTPEWDERWDDHLHGTGLGRDSNQPAQQEREDPVVAGIHADMERVPVPGVYREVRSEGVVKRVYASPSLVDAGAVEALPPRPSVPTPGTFASADVAEQVRLELANKRTMMPNDLLEQGHTLETTEPPQPPGYRDVPVEDGIWRWHFGARIFVFEPSR